MLSPLGYPALRLRWCRVAVLAFLRRWGVYGVVAAALFGAGSNSPIDSAAAVAAWLVLPLFRLASQPAALLGMALLQSALGGALVWAMRPLLWPASWGAAERGLPIPRRDLLRSDLAVVALCLLPLGLLYALGAATWLLQRPAWLMPWRGAALLALVAVALGSVAAGVLVLQVVRRPRVAALAAGPRPRLAPVPGAAVAGNPRRGMAAPVGPAWALLALPLWRGPARRSGRALLAGALALVALAIGLHLAPSALAGWWLAAFAALGMLVTTRVNNLSRAELLPLILACASLPLAPRRLQRQRAWLALLPCALGLGVLALALPWQAARGPVAVAFMTVCLAVNAVEVTVVSADATHRSSRWLFLLALMVALASEVMA